MQGVDQRGQLGGGLGGERFAEQPTSPIWAGAALTLAGLGVLLAALRLARRQEPAKADAALVETAA